MFLGCHSMFRGRFASFRSPLGDARCRRHDEREARTNHELDNPHRDRRVKLNWIWLERYQELGCRFSNANLLPPSLDAVWC